VQGQASNPRHGLETSAFHHPTGFSRREPAQGRSSYWRAKRHRRRHRKLNLPDSVKVPGPAAGGVLKKPQDVGPRA